MREMMSDVMRTRIICSEMDGRDVVIDGEMKWVVRVDRGHEMAV